MTIKVKGKPDSNSTNVTTGVEAKAKPWNASNSKRNNKIEYKRVRVSVRAKLVTQNAFLSL